MLITCDCKVKENLTTNINDIEVDLWNYEHIYKSSYFKITKCYNLIFSFKDKINNIGF